MSCSSKNMEPAGLTQNQPIVLVIFGSSLVLFLGASEKMRLEHLEMPRKYLLKFLQKLFVMIEISSMLSCWHLLYFLVFFGVLFICLQIYQETLLQRGEYYTSLFQDYILLFLFTLLWIIYLMKTRIW